MSAKTGRILRYIFIALIYSALLIYVVAFDNATGWGLFFFLTFFLLFSLLSLLPSLKTIHASIEETLLCHVNEKRRVEIEISKRHRTFFPIPKLMVKLKSAFFPIPELNISFSDVFKKDCFVLHFYRGDKKKISLNWMPKIRGYYQSLPVEYHADDLFEIFSKKHGGDIRTDIIILPEVDEHAAALMSIFQEKRLVSQYGDARFAIKSFRKYQPGDPLKFIDWKLSSKHQDLIFREHETELHTEISVLFWGCPSKYFEKTLSIYYSLQEELRKKIKFKPYLFGENIKYPERVEAKSFAVIQPFSAPPLIPNIKHQQMFIFTPEIDDQLMAQVALLRKNNLVYVYDYTDLKAILLPTASDSVREVQTYA